MTDDGSATTGDRRIVVGLDGSPGSLAALHWAIAQARMSRRTVEVVVAARRPPAHGFGYGLDSALRERELEPLQAQQILDGVIAEAAHDRQVPTVRLVGRVVDGAPLPVLLDAAEGADMLVIGRHTRHSVVEALLGSISDLCVRHSPCPVVVLP